MQVLMSMHIPSPNPSCSEPGCSIQGCKGNRLKSLGEEVWPCLPEGYNSKLKFHVVHHKLERLGQGPLTFVLPPALTELTHMYLKHCHPIITLGSESQLLFPNNTRPGNSAHDHVSFNHWWTEIQLQLEAPWDSFPPSVCRKIFGDFTLEELLLKHQLNPNPLALGATTVMGNSLKVVHSHYSKQAKSLYAEAAIQAVQAWRQERLGAGGASNAHVHASSSAPVVEHASSAPVVVHASNAPVAVAVHASSSAPVVEHASSAPVAVHAASASSPGTACNEAGAVEQEAEWQDAVEQWGSDDVVLPAAKKPRWGAWFGFGW